MCGIAGIVSFRNPISVERLIAASKRLSHRGPDDDGIYIDDLQMVGLVHRRLSIIDISASGHQPMLRCEREGDVVLVFNGEIFNYGDVRAECNHVAMKLRGEAIPWTGTSDTEVVLWAYLLWGEAALEIIEGMFAIAIWDGRKRAMILARDRFGVKPMYVSASRERLSFASELKALQKIDTVDTEIDPIAVAQYVSFLFTPGERTMFKAVRKLGPGEKLVVNQNGEIRREQFAAGFAASPMDQSLTVRSAAEQLRYLLDSAVKRQMVADVPVGAFLSGGLDSSSIVSFARKHAEGRKLQCFTIGNRGHAGDRGWVDDLPYAERVAKHLGVDLHTIWVGPEMAGQFEWMVEQLDEPQADPAALNAYYICKLAREKGVKVLLSGAGGDDIFSGYRRHDALLLERWWSWLPSSFRMPLRVIGNHIGKDTAIGRRFAKAFQHADSTREERLIGYFRWLSHDLVTSLLGSSMAGALKGCDVAEPMRAALHKLPRKTHPLEQMLHLDSKFFLVDHNLSYTDKMSMAASVEVRVPFMDPKLVAFAASLPADLKHRDRTGKWIFRRAMEPFLPLDVINRPKTGFGVPLRTWLRGPLRGHVDDALAHATVARRGLFDPREVSALLQRDREGRIDASYPLFALVCIEIWCRRFIDTPAF